MFGSGNTTSIISYEEMNDIMKKVKSLEESGLLIKRFRETFKNEVKKLQGRFLGMLLTTLGAISLEHLLTGKDTIRHGKGKMRASKGTIRAGGNF